MRAVDVDDEVDEDFDEEDRMPPKMIIAILFLQTFIVGVSFSIIIPTSRQYAESLGASDGFSGLTVGAVGLASALVTPLYRYLVKRSFAGCLYFEVAMMQIGGLLYSLAQLAKTMWVMLVARIFTGIGSGKYPIYQFVAEQVGKRHRSSVTSLTSGIARTLGLAMGPITASILVYVDFSIGDLQVNKETNAGWVVAILCVVQGLLVFWYFPKHGSYILQKGARDRLLPEQNGNTNPAIPLKERVLYHCAILNTIFNFVMSMICIAAWEVAATKVIQTIFKWSIQNSALLVGGFILTTGPTLYVSGKLSYKYDDRKILIACIGVTICAIVLMFQYGTPMLIIPYLIGCFFFINSTYIICAFSLALSSKIPSLQHMEPVQAFMNVAGTVGRGIGAISGDVFSPNVLAIIFMCLSITSLISTLLLYTRLVPSRLGV